MNKDKEKETNTERKHLCEHKIRTLESEIIMTKLNIKFFKDSIKNYKKALNIEISELPIKIDKLKKDLIILRKKLNDEKRIYNIYYKNIRQAPWFDYGIHQEELL